MVALFEFRQRNMLFLVGLGLPAKLTSSSSPGNISRIAFCACASASSIPEPFLWAIASARSAACKDEPAFCQLCKGPIQQFASHPSICGIRIRASFSGTSIFTIMHTFCRGQFVLIVYRNCGCLYNLKYALEVILLYFAFSHWLAGIRDISAPGQ
jgi:hypothetical protein